MVNSDYPVWYGYLETNVSAFSRDRTMRVSDVKQQKFTFELLDYLDSSHRSHTPTTTTTTTSQQQKRRNKLFLKRTIWWIGGQNQLNFERSSSCCCFKLVQCDQIGRFLKSLGDNFSYKSSPTKLKVTQTFQYFCRKFGLLLISISGHTVPKLPTCCLSSSSKPINFLS